jgi:SH3-like domain-containing protein
MVSASLARAGRAALLLLAASAVPVHAGTVAPVPAVSSRGPVTNLPLPRFVSMRAEVANARRGPSFDQRVDWEFVHRGQPLEVTGEYGQWRRVRDADGFGGWVHHTLLSGLRTAVVRAEAPVALRTGPGEGEAVRAMAEPGVIGRVEACAAAWCEIAAGGLSGWLPRAALWGVGADETIE